MSRTQRDNIFTQAAFGKNVWRVAMAIMNKFETGQLKNQKLSRKHLVSTPEFKQHLLQPLHHLDKELQESVLQKVLDDELSLEEMKISAMEFRNLGVVKNAFLRLTSSESWAEAEDKFPAFTTTERLSNYSALDFKKGVPDIFRIYCQAAIDSTVVSAAPQSALKKVIDGVSVFLVEEEFTSISTEHFRNIDSTFTGAHMIIYRIPKVSKVYTFTVS